MSPNRSSLEAVVQSYFDGLYEGDAEKLGAIFHPSADLRWVEKGELQVLTVPDWLDRVRKRPSGKAEGKPREDFIVTIDRSDDKTAFVKVRCQLPPRYFTDYLVAMKLADGLADCLEILSIRPERVRGSTFRCPKSGALVSHSPSLRVKRGNPESLRFAPLATTMRIECAASPIFIRAKVPHAARPPLPACLAVLDGRISCAGRGCAA